jgi:hypothetical protein
LLKIGCCPAPRLLALSRLHLINLFLLSALIPGESGRN